MDVFRCKQKRWLSGAEVNLFASTITVLKIDYLFTLFKKYSYKKVLWKNVANLATREYQGWCLTSIKLHYNFTLKSLNVCVFFWKLTGFLYQTLLTEYLWETTSIFFLSVFIFKMYESIWLIWNKTQEVSYLTHSRIKG